MLAEKIVAAAALWCIEVYAMWHVPHLRRDLVKVSEWCDLWSMKLNVSKTKTMIVSRSHTMHPSHPH